MTKINSNRAKNKVILYVVIITIFLYESESDNKLSILLEGTRMAALPVYSRHTPDTQSTTDLITL